MKKFFLLISAVLLSVSVGAAERIVWAGNQTISWNQEAYAGITMEVYNFEGLTVGDVIKVYGMPKPDAEYVTYSLKYKAGGSWTWTDLTTTVTNNICSYVVSDATIATEITERGLIVTGIGYELKKITIATGDGQKEIWRQEGLPIFYVDGSSNYSFDSRDSAVVLSSIRPGYTLKVYTENPVEFPYYQLQYKDGESWDVWNTIANSAGANGVISYTIETVDKAEKIRDRGLVINGNGYAINRISVEKALRYTLWEGSTTYDWSWIAGQGYLSSDVSQLAEGDKIIVTISATSGDNRQMKILNQNTQGESPTFVAIAENTALPEGAQVLEHTLTAAEVIALKAGYAGIILQGYGCNATKVELEKSSRNIDEHTVWQYHGKQISWNNDYYPGSQFYTYEGGSHIIDFSCLRNGMTLRWYVTAGVANPTYQIHDRSGNEWADVTLEVNTANAPTVAGETGVITYAVNAEKAAVIAERGLNITGQGYDLNRVVIEVPTTDFTLSDESNSSDALIRLNALSEPVNLTINRNIYKDGYYNTLCLPFNLASLDETPLADATVMEYAGVEITGTKDGDDMVMDVTVEQVNAIEAGKPYLVSFPSGSDITSMTFRGVTISTTSPQTIASAGLNMVGILAPTDLADTENMLFLGSENTLYWSNGSNPLKGFRAYFEISGGASAPVRRGMSARIVERHNTPTGVEHNTYKGNVQKHIVAGQVVIVRDGVQYNALGQIINH